MGSTRQTDLREEPAAAAALDALARATPAEAASALRLWQSRTGRTDAQLSTLLQQLECELEALPKGTSGALAAAEIPREPSSALELYAQVIVFLEAVRGSASLSRRAR